MTVEILSVHQFPSAEKERLGQPETLVLFSIDGVRRDTVMIPKAVTDPEEIAQIITEELKKRSALIGHKFEIK